MIAEQWLGAQVKAELAGVASLPSWQASEPESKFNLPAFSAYPQAYATAAGEYLMMLPQLLETLLAASEEEGAEEAQVDADWLDKVGTLEPVNAPEALKVSG